MNRKMDKKCGLMLLFCVLILILSFVAVGSAETWSVNGSNSTVIQIQEAIDTASAGDTILVYSGVYHENVVVDKPVTLKGIGCPVVDASGSGIAITLRADGITLAGFNVTNSLSSRGDVGIKVISCNNVVTGNNVSNNAHGISIYKSRNNTITGNDVCDNNDGLNLYSSSVNTITNNNICNNRYGIRLDESDSNNIADNNVSSNNAHGVRSRYSNSNTFTGNTVCNNYERGFYLGYSSNDNTITGNTVCNNRFGIVLDESGYNVITGNTVSNNSDGIALKYSDDNAITGNTFVNGALFVLDSYKNLVEENIVNGKPLVYLEDASDIVVTDAGQVIVVNCNNIRLENLVLSDTNVGVALWETENSSISNSKVCNNSDGIYLWYASNNSITGNDVCNNDDGICLRYARNNNIAGNDVRNNSDGIRLDKSYNNTIASNDVCGNDDGIYLSFSCFNNSITGNTFVNDGFFVYSSYQNTVEGNIVNGKPLVYLEDTADIVVSDAGQVILLNCDNITIENLDLSNTSAGIELVETENSRILNTKICNNKRGIGLYGSSSNSITGNNVSNNNGYGISIDRSENNTIACNNVRNNKRGINLIKSCSNRIYRNNFINNGDPVYSIDATNIWNSIEEITYIYNGTNHESCLGNYWDDHEEKYPDAEEVETTGIWNLPYCIDMDNDFYPLTMRFENYFPMIF